MLAERGAYRKGLAAYSDCTDCLDGLIRTAKADGAELGRYLGRVKSLDTTLDNLRSEILEGEDAGALAALIDGLTAHDPKHGQLEVLRADLARLQNEAPP